MNECSRCHPNQCSCEYGPVVNGRLPPCPPAPPCQCGRKPCICGQGHFQMHNDVNPCRGKCTLCTGDVHQNVWHQPPPPGFNGPGRCILDELTFAEVLAVLVRNRDAKKDLLRITHDEDLIILATNSKIIQDPIEADLRVTNMINKGPNALPIYTLFHGNLDGSIGRPRKQ